MNMPFKKKLSNSICHSIHYAALSHNSSCLFLFSNFVHVTVQHLYIWCMRMHDCTHTYIYTCACTHPYTHTYTNASVAMKYITSVCNKC